MAITFIIKSRQNILLNILIYDIAFCADMFLHEKQYVISMCFIILYKGDWIC